MTDPVGTESISDFLRYLFVKVIHPPKLINMIVVLLRSCKFVFSSFLSADSLLFSKPKMSVVLCFVYFLPAASLLEKNSLLQQ